MPAIIDPIVVAPDAHEQLVAYCAARHPNVPLTLVADERTFAAAGERVARLLTAAGRSVYPIVLRGENLHADEVSLARVLTASLTEPTLFVAVGSGTITDITRYISRRLGRPFVAVPTAASVDGYASAGSPLVIEGVKRTHRGQTAEAIFADTRVLAAAPSIMTAAGMGDLLGKISSVADWKLGQLIQDEPFDAAIATRAEAAVQRGLSALELIARRTEAGVAELFNALIETGLCMVDAGDSRPASGAEHHISHVWEMAALRDGAPTALHGIQVGIATVIVAELYATIRGIDAPTAARLLAGRLPLDRAAQEAEIRAAYGEQAQTIIRDHDDYLALGAARQRALADRIIARWSAVQEIAAGVPEPHRIRELLQRAGAPVETTALCLPQQVVTAGIQRAHYLRSRFTVAKLSHLLGILEDVE